MSLANPEDKWWQDSNDAKQIIRLYTENDCVIMGTNHKNVGSSEYPVAFPYFVQDGPPALKVHILLYRLKQEIIANPQSQQNMRNARRIISALITILPIKPILPFTISHGEHTYGRGYCLFIALYQSWLREHGSENFPPITTEELQSVAGKKEFLRFLLELPKAKKRPASSLGGGGNTKHTIESFKDRVKTIIDKVVDAIAIQEGKNKKKSAEKVIRDSTQLDGLEERDYGITEDIKFIPNSVVPITLFSSSNLYSSMSSNHERVFTKRLNNIFNITDQTIRFAFFDNSNYYNTSQHQQSETIMRGCNYYEFKEMALCSYFICRHSNHFQRMLKHKHYSESDPEFKHYEAAFVDLFVHLYTFFCSSDKKETFRNYIVNEEKINELTALEFTLQNDIHEARYEDQSGDNNNTLVGRIYDALLEIQPASSSISSFTEEENNDDNCTMQTNHINPPTLQPTTLEADDISTLELLVVKLPSLYNSFLPIIQKLSYECNAIYNCLGNVNPWINFQPRFDAFNYGSLYNYHIKMVQLMKLYFQKRLSNSTIEEAALKSAEVELVEKLIFSVNFNILKPEEVTTATTDDAAVIVSERITNLDRLRMLFIDPIVHEDFMDKYIFCAMYKYTNSSTKSYDLNTNGISFPLVSYVAQKELKHQLFDTTPMIIPCPISEAEALMAMLTLTNHLMNHFIFTFILHEEFGIKFTSDTFIKYLQQTKSHEIDCANQYTDDILKMAREEEEGSVNLNPNAFNFTYHCFQKSYTAHHNVLKRPLLEQTTRKSNEEEEVAMELMTSSSEESTVNDEEVSQYTCESSSFDLFSDFMVEFMNEMKEKASDTMKYAAAISCECNLLLQNKGDTVKEETMEAVFNQLLTTTTEEDDIMYILSIVSSVTKLLFTNSSFPSLNKNVGGSINIFMNVVHDATLYIAVVGADERILAVLNGGCAAANNTSSLLQNLRNMLNQLTAVDVDIKTIKKRVNKAVYNDFQKGLILIYKSLYGLSNCDPISENEKQKVLQAYKIDIKVVMYKWAKMMNDIQTENLLSETFAPLLYEEF